MIFPFKKTYSDAEYVYGVKNGNPKIQNSFYEHCKNYFDQKYTKLFFTDDDKKNDIFEDAFIIVWQKIERGDIYVQNGQVMAQGGKQMTCNLNTFMMSVAWNKFREYARKHKEILFEDMFENAGNVLGISTPWGDPGDEIEGMKLDIIATCIAKMPKRCCQILTMFYYEGKKLDSIMLELQSFTSKDALKTAKNKCYTTLKNNVLQQYKVAMINY